MEVAKLSETDSEQNVSAFADYSEKNEQYFAGVRADFIDRLPDNPHASLLEVGCGAGDTAAAAKQHQKCGFTAGIELIPHAAARAEQQLDQVVLGNVELVPFPWSEPTFDVVILSEVIEHFADPWKTLRRIHDLCKPQAIVLASSPNVAYWRNAWELLRGDWSVADSGHRDRTHLRWFTPRSYRQLFEETGFAVDAVWPLAPLRWKAQIANRITFGALEHLFIYQICIQATCP